MTAGPVTAAALLETWHVIAAELKTLVKGLF
jgi:hypothetical protein